MSNQPLLRYARSQATKLNNYRILRSGLEFDGIDDVMSFAQQSFPEFTLFFLARPETDVVSGSNAQTLVAKATDSGDRGQFVFGQIGSLFTLDEVISVVHNEGANTRGVSNSDSTQVVSSSQLNIVTFTSDNVVRLNGQSLSVQQADDGDVTGFGLENVDSLMGQNTGNHYNGLFFELFLYARALSENELLQMESFFAEEYPSVESQQLAFVTAQAAEGLFPDPFVLYSFNNSDLVGGTLLEPFRGFNASLINSPTTGVVGQQGQAISFTGASSHRAEILDNELFQFEIDQSFSISSWFRTSSDSQWLIGKIRTDTVITPGWGVYMTAGGNLQVVLGEPTVGRVVTTIAAFNDGSFHNVVVTYDGSNTAAGIVINVDGVPVTTSTTLDTDPGSIVNSLNVQIGSQDPLASIPGYWTGLVDETALWDVKLT